MSYKAPIIIGPMRPDTVSTPEGDSIDRKFTASTGPSITPIPMSTAGIATKMEADRVCYRQALNLLAH